MFRLLACLCAGLTIAGTAWAQGPATVKAARKIVTLSGYTRSRAKQTLAAEVAGKVLAVNYDVGRVIGEKPFLEIDPTFIDFQIDQTALTLEKLMVSNTRAKSQKEFLQKEFQRIDRLRQGNVATVAKWEAAAEELKQAELALQTTDVEIKSLEIQIKELKERLKRHQLMAPKGWIVVARNVEPGEIIGSGSPLGQAADFTQMVVPLFVSGRQLAAIRKQGQLNVLVEGKSGRAKLNWVNPEFDERSRKIAIELGLIDFKDEVRGGLLTELAVEEPVEGVMVPKSSITNRYNNPHVTVKKSGKAVPITILDESGDYVIVADTSELTVGAELTVR